VDTFNKTKAAIFPCRLYFLRAFPFSQFVYSGNEKPKGSYALWKNNRDKIEKYHGKKCYTNVYSTGCW